MPGTKLIYPFLFFILLIAFIFVVMLPNLPGYFGTTENNIVYFAAISVFIIGLLGIVWGFK